MSPEALARRILARRASEVRIDGRREAQRKSAQFSTVRLAPCALRLSLTGGRLLPFKLRTGAHQIMGVQIHHIDFDPRIDSQLDGIVP